MEWTCGTAFCLMCSSDRCDLLCTCTTMCIHAKGSGDLGCYPRRLECKLGDQASREGEECNGKKLKQRAHASAHKTAESVKATCKHAQAETRAHMCVQESVLKTDVSVFCIQCSERVRAQTSA